MNNIFKSLCLIAALGITACAEQHTPSMMNYEPLRVAEETVIDQIPAASINDSTIAMMADHYTKHANGPMDLTMTYNPKSRSFGKYSAGKKLKMVESKLRAKGIDTIYTNTMPVPNGDPMLVISYDTLKAMAPADCGKTPGLHDYQTGRFIEEYRFGCGVETMFAKQITNPSDLYGKSDMGERDGRRESVVTEPHMAGVPNTPIQGVETNERIGN